VAQLSSQLRRFLDDKAWLKNKRIMEILRQIKSNARDTMHQPPQDWDMSMDEMKVEFTLPMERPLYQPPLQTVLDAVQLEMGAEDADAEALFSQVVIDKGHLKQVLAQALQQHSQISLADLLHEHPLQHGLAELVVWLQMGSEMAQCMIDEQKEEMIQWQTDDGLIKQVMLPHVLFVR